jgi:release factor glutamine methyltransferase
MPHTLTVAQALQQAQQRGVDRLDARMLLCTLLEQTTSWLLSHDQDALPPETRERYLALLQRRADGEPLAYLLGDKAFFGLTLRVTPDTLIPRPDTETLVEWALTLIPDDQATRVIDLGTGSGAIALALAHERPQAQLTAVDASAGALNVARDNAQSLGLNVRFVHGSWLTPLAGERFDLIVSNPPYIAEGDPHMAALRFEPTSALTSGADGLEDIRHIIQQAPAHLNAQAWLLLEHGYDQAVAVAQLLQARGFANVSTRFDLGGQARCTGGQWSI